MMESIWTSTVTMPHFPPLWGDVRTDVLVIGGGMAGLLCARALQEAGINCAVAEAKTIAGGITKNTTAKNHSPARPDFLGASEPLWCGARKTLLAGQPGCLGSIRYPMSANRLRLYGAGSFHLFQNRPANSGTGALRPGCHWLSSRANTAAAAPLPHCGSGEVSKASPVSSPEISLRHFRETDHLRKHPHPGTYKRCSHHGSWRNPCRCVCCCHSFSIP